MIPFPGESVGCVDAWASDGYGYDLWQDVMLRGTSTPNSPTPGHRVISSGTEWRCWAYHLDYHSYLDESDTTPLVVGWVVEVLSGSGTLFVSDYHDDDWDQASTGTLPNSLGTLTVTGAGTYVMPTTSFTNAILAELGWDRGPAEVRLQCSAGSIDVQQVKLRMWPVGGPLGGWSDDSVTDPSQNIYPQVWAQDASVIEPPEQFADQAEFRAALAVGTVSGSASLVFSGNDMGGGAFTALHTEYDPEIAPNFHDYGGTPGFTYLRVNPGHLAGPAGVDWTRPPEEVQGELDSIIFQTDGSGTITWLQGTVSWRASSSTSDLAGTWYFASGSWHMSMEEVSDFLDNGDGLTGHIATGAPVASMVSPGAYSAPAVLSSFSMPELTPSQLYRINWWHDGFLGDVDEDWDGTMAGGSTTLEVFRGAWPTHPEDSVDLLRATWTPPPYRYWAPSVAPRYPHVIFQRHDNLGAGGALVYNLDTRQSTGLVYGNY